MPPPAPEASDPRRLRVARGVLSPTAMLYAWFALLPLVVSAGLFVGTLRLDRRAPAQPGSSSRA